MPKIVDHEKCREDLARAAAELFSRFGYSGLGMRQIAADLGVSKSALYHYFPTKKDLFAACTEVVTQGAEDQVHLLAGHREDMTDEDRISAVRALFEELLPTFASELSLLMDYLRNRAPEDVAADRSMQLANRRYRALFVALAGEEEADAVYCLVIGAMLKHHLDGGATCFADIENGLWAILKTRSEQ